MADVGPGLETRLSALAAELAYPPTPNLGAAVRSRIAPRTAVRTRWRWALVAALLLALAFGSLAIPRARETVADWLGIKGINIQKVQHPPSPPARSSGSVGERLGLGRPETLAEAARFAGSRSRCRRCSVRLTRCSTGPTSTP